MFSDLGHALAIQGLGPDLRRHRPPIECCKLSGLNPHTRLTETLAKLVGGHAPNSVDELMSWTAAQ